MFLNKFRDVLKKRETGRSLMIDVIWVSFMLPNVFMNVAESLL